MARAFEQAWTLDAVAIVEHFAKGREVTCSVLDVDGHATPLAADAPGRGGNTVDGREGTEEAAARRDNARVIGSAKEGLALPPAEQARVEGREQPRRKAVGIGRRSAGRLGASRRLRTTSRQLDQAAVELDQFGADRPQSISGVTQRQAGPFRQVGVRGRTVAAQIPACQLGQRPLACFAGDRPPFAAEPVSRVRERVTAGQHRTEHGPSARHRGKEDVHRRLAFRPDASGSQPLAKLGSQQRTFGGQARLDAGDAAIHLVGREALLGEAARVRHRLRRGRQGQQPRVVLAADQVKSAAVEPGHDQRPLLSERAVDVGGADALDAGAQGQSPGASILRLDGQQRPNSRLRPAADPAVQQLGRRTANQEFTRVHYSAGGGGGGAARRSPIISRPSH